MIVDLNLVTDEGGVHNLAGKPRGESARAFFRLDTLDVEPDDITVKAPDYLTNISSSYFLGLFSPSIERLGGREGFLRKYHFEATPQILRAIQHGIDLALMARGPLRVSPLRRFG